MSEGVLISEIPWTDYDRRLREESPVVMLPIGALEQHGPHLPMNCDSVIPAAISERVADNIGGLVAPTISYGYKSQPKSGGGNHFPGTTSLDGATLTSLVRDVIKEFTRHGVRKLALMVGHYENTMFTVEGIDLALRDLGSAGAEDLKILRVDYWDFTREETLAQVYPDGFPGWPLEHAGVMETSVMMYLYPELVRADRIPTGPPASFPPYDVYPFDPARAPASGALSSARIASREKGELLVSRYVEDISQALVDEFALSNVRGARGGNA